MPSNPSLDVVSLLDALSSLTRGTNLFRGPERAPSTAVPSQAVFVLVSGGPASEAYADGTNVERAYSALQIIVRSNPNDYSGGDTLARQVRAALHHASVPGYLDLRAMQSEPIYLGEDEAGSHRWSINVECWREV
jgi:hypothetical protein